MAAIVKAQHKKRKQQTARTHNAKT